MKKEKTLLDKELQFKELEQLLKDKEGELMAKEKNLNEMITSLKDGRGQPTERKNQFELQQRSRLFEE